jgi:hypothetical protein
MRIRSKVGVDDGETASFVVVLSIIVESSGERFHFRVIQERDIKGIELQKCVENKDRRNQKAFYFHWIDGFCLFTTS